jgi:hypothetical protein
MTSSKKEQRHAGNLQQPVLQNARKEGSIDRKSIGIVGKKKRKVLMAKKTHVLYITACAEIKIEMAFKMAYVITIN